MRTYSWTCVPLLLAVLASACSTSPVGGNVVFTDAENGIGNYGFGDAKGADSKGKADAGATADTQADGTTDDVAAPTHQLLFVQKNDDFGGFCDSLCALILYQNALRSLKVQYLVGGEPRPDALIEFALDDQNTTLANLLSTNVPPDEKGFAQADIKSSNQVGTVGVTVRVPDDPEAGELHFDLHIQSKAKGPLEIRVHYQGAKSLSEFGMVKLRLTEQESPGQPACKDIDLGDALPAAKWESPNLKWDNNDPMTTQPWIITSPLFSSSLPQTGEPVTFTVIGVASANSGSNALAAGCDDMAATVHWSGTSVEGNSVVITIKDIPPRLKGIYDLTTHLNLLSVLPPTVENVLTTIIDIVTDPVAGLLALVCKLGNGKLDSICGAVFDDPAKPNINDLKQPFGGLIVKLLDAVLLSLLPANVKEGLAAGADLGEILTNLEIGGTLEIQAEPDNTGFLDKAHTKQDWASVTYKWSLGQSCAAADPNCGKKTFSIDAFQTNAITGQFDLWRDSFKSEIKIGQHALNVKWGALVNFIVQKQVLPLLFKDPKNPGAPPVDSYDKLFKSLVGGKGCLMKDMCCENFAAGLNKQSLFSATFLTAACETVATLGSAFLESTLVGLDAPSGDPASGKGLLLAADHCAALDINQDQFIDNLGLKSSPCTWDMTLNLLGKPKALKSTFFAKRQQ